MPRSPLSVLPVCLWSTGSQINLEQDPDIYYSCDADAYTPDDWKSETTTIRSSIYQGFVENGRSVPSDEQQFDTYEAGYNLLLSSSEETLTKVINRHITAFVMESHRENPLFRSPVGEDLKRCSRQVSTRYVDLHMRYHRQLSFPATVRGVDLFPPPVSWLPPNCILEVDDVTKEWTWQQPFDLVHMRLLDAAFTPEENEEVLYQCYRSLRPGGWIELLELTADFQSEDNSWSEDCPLKGFMSLMKSAAAKTGRPLHLYHRCVEFVKSAGFLDIHEEVKKWPIGPWPRDDQLKEAGSLNLEHWMVGAEGYVMYLLTKFGDPTPWSHDEVQVYLAHIRKELKDHNNHIYHRVLVIPLSAGIWRAKDDAEKGYGPGSHSLMKLFSRRWKESIDCLQLRSDLKTKLEILHPRVFTQEVI
ncbi:unnamed protein product [Penicillium salamii]|uniref:Uncharacterized protein n=1 Tax=Penicillium salamii TaxID=1612424 RepID=A0A9W4NRN5_9EURO|nr:unnamed protein product [Penicillium salamii]CAG8246152.1 unnamed protein product [Penicillium salamii]CAG8398803.1 unnamed protein product [Penicillium salamii]